MRDAQESEVIADQVTTIELIELEALSLVEEDLQVLVSIPRPGTSRSDPLTWRSRPDASDGDTLKFGLQHRPHGVDEFRRLSPNKSGPTLRISVPDVRAQEVLGQLPFAITVAIAYPYLEEDEVAQLFETFDGCLDGVRDDLEMCYSEITIKVPYIDLLSTQALICLVVNSLSDDLVDRVVWVKACELSDNRVECAPGRSQGLPSDPSAAWSARPSSLAELS